MKLSSQQRGLYWALGLFGLPLAYAFCFALKLDGNGLSSLHNVWGDWSFHLSLVSSFAHRPVSLWLDHPTFAGNPLHYPFWINLFSGLLLKVSGSFWFSVCLPSMLLGFIYVGFLYRFALQQVKRPGLALVFLALVLANGGLGFIYWFQDLASRPDVFRNGFPILSYTNHAERNLYYMNYLTGSFIPQRSWLLGAPWMLWILVRLWRANPEQSLREWGKLGALAGVLLVLHPHTFVCLGFFAAAYFLVQPKAWRRAAAFAAGVCAVGGPLYLVFLRGTGGSSFWAWAPGWYSAETKPSQDFFTFWWWNAGLFLPLALIGTIRLKLWRHPFVQAGWSLFLFANLFRMQPWLWDNTKLFAWSQVALAIPVALLLGEIWDKKIWGKVASGILVLLLTLSGLIDLSRLFYSTESYVPMWSTAEMEIAKEFQLKSEPSARVLTTPVPHNWVSALSGRQVLMGYPAWIWSHGVDSRPREAEITTMLSGEPGALGLIEKLGVDYVVIGPSERSKQAKEEFFRLRYPLFMENRSTRIYKVR